jgi:hypothetical protein
LFISIPKQKDSLERAQKSERAGMCVQQKKGDVSKNSAKARA